MAASFLQDRLHGHSIVLLNRSAAYAVGVADFLPVTVICSLEDGVEFASLSERMRIPILQRELAGEPRRLHPDEAIDTVLPDVKPRLARIVGSDTRKIWLWCPRRCGTAWDYARQHDFGNLCMEPSLAGELTDKRNSLPGMAALGLPVVRGEWSRPDQCEFASRKKRFGLPFVAQAPLSVAGAGTTIVHKEEDWRRACQGSDAEPLWVAPYIGDVSVNVNAVVTSAGIFVGWPSVQLTSMDFCHALPAAYCGNDYAAAERLSEREHSQIRTQALCVGRWLASRGYQGVFGMDLVRTDSGTFHPVDLNARWQGSTALLAQGESEADAVPLAALAVVSQMGLLLDEELRKLAELSPPVDACFFMLRSPRNAVRCTASLAAGVYSLPDAMQGRTTFLREGFHLSDLRSDDEYLLGGGMPRTGQQMAPGANLLRVTRRGPALCPTLRSYLPWTKRVAESIYAALQLEVVNGSPDEDAS